LIWTGIVFLTGQVIFVPEWPKGEFVSFCVGFILLDQNHIYVMLLFSQGCYFIQSLLFSYVLQEDSMNFSRKFISVPCQPSGRSSHSVRTTICPLFHLSGRRVIPSERPTDQASFVWTTYISVLTFTVSRSFCSSYIHSNVSAAHPDAS
jgi:hypothetical protein